MSVGVHLVCERERERIMNVSRCASCVCVWERETEREDNECQFAALWMSMGGEGVHACAFLKHPSKDTLIWQSLCFMNICDIAIILKEKKTWRSSLPWKTPHKQSARRSFVHWCMVIIPIMWYKWLQKPKKNTQDQDRINYQTIKRSININKPT